VTWNQCDPPKKVPAQGMAYDLGLCDGLRVELSDHQYRCSNCNVMQKPNSLMVWVPDNVKSGDPEWSISEQCRINAYNGDHSAWCMKCAPKKESSVARVPVGRISVIEKIMRWLKGQMNV
jgi:hypothetical protein